MEPSQDDVSDPIDRFLSQPPFAVVGASKDRAKFGNRVLRAYLQHGLEALPVHPKEAEVEGIAAFASLTDLVASHGPIASVSIITPPAITERVVAEAADAGVQTVWMQPGAESDAAIELARDRGMTVIAEGPCVLVELPRRIAVDR